MTNCDAIAAELRNFCEMAGGGFVLTLQQNILALLDERDALEARLDAAEATMIKLETEVAEYCTMLNEPERDEYETERWKLNARNAEARVKLLELTEFGGMHLVRAEAAEARVRELEADLAEARRVLEMSLEYWAHRQQRYKNRSPAWVQSARAAWCSPTPSRSNLFRPSARWVTSAGSRAATSPSRCHGCALGPRKAGRGKLPLFLPSAPIVLPRLMQNI